MNARLFLFLLASVGVGCGLVQVNGKPITFGSSSASQEQAEPEPKPKQTQTASTASSSALAAGPAEVPGEPGKKLHDIPHASVKRLTWTPVQQYMRINEAESYWAVIVGDELGDKLSQAGRLAIIRTCFGRTKGDARDASLWAICGADVEAMNLDAFAGELAKEGLDKGTRTELVNDAKETLDKAKAIGTKVTAAAKDDAGVAAVLAAGPTARTDWQAFASAHTQALATLEELQELARENKNGRAGDCVAKTQSTFAKIARVTKWPEYDTVLSPIEWYANKLPNTTETYIAALSWGACAFLSHKSGEALYAAVGNTAWGKDDRERRYARRGPRSLTVAKLFGEPFKAKFADRSLSMAAMVEPSGKYQVVGGYATLMTPTDASIAKLVKDGDSTAIKFSSDRVMECTNWRDTNKVQSVSPNGDVMYEKECMKREAVHNEHSDVVTGSDFTGGLGPGVAVMTVDGFPVIASKGNKFVAALGVKL